MKINYSGRSSNYITPNFLIGCFGGCQYCYAARHYPHSFYNNVKLTKNVNDILTTIKNYDTSSITKPDQTHEKYITWDLACNSDIVAGLHLFDWQKVFDYFKNSERDFGTFATKFVNHKLLKYNPERKIRVRMSLMPEKLSEIIEPNTSTILKRINFINKLYDAGYEVHVNFSPVIVFDGWKEEYNKLFNLIDLTLKQEVKEQLACEVIFLTHNKQLHEFNIQNNKALEFLLWNDLQENKISKLGGNNVRYQYQIKANFINSFKDILTKHLPYCRIRYIF